MRDVVEYRGCMIFRNTKPNALRWTCRVDGRSVTADTLEGIKRLIKDELGVTETRQPYQEKPQPGLPPVKRNKPVDHASPLTRTKRNIRSSVSTGVLAKGIGNA